VYDRRLEDRIGGKPFPTITEPGTPYCCDPKCPYCADLRKAHEEEIIEEEPQPKAA
jgi:hypothetical protein